MKTLIKEKPSYETVSLWGMALPIEYTPNKNDVNCVANIESGRIGEWERGWYSAGLLKSYGEGGNFTDSSLGLGVGL